MSFGLNVIRSLCYSLFMTIGGSLGLQIAHRGSPKIVGQYGAQFFKCKKFLGVKKAHHDEKLWRFTQFKKKEEMIK